MGVVLAMAIDFMYLKCSITTTFVAYLNFTDSPFNATTNFGQQLDNEYHVPDKMFPQLGPDELPDLPTPDDENDDEETDDNEEDVFKTIPLGYNPDTGEVYHNQMSDPDVPSLFSKLVGYSKERFSSFHII